MGLISRVSSRTYRDKNIILGKKMSTTCFLCEQASSKRHPLFKLKLCNSCYDFYHEPNWSYSDGSCDYCRMCAQGGDIIACDNSTCKEAFCIECLGKTMNHKLLINLQEDESLKWECISCKPTSELKTLEFIHFLVKSISSKFISTQNIANLLATVIFIILFF